MKSIFNSHNILLKALLALALCLVSRTAWGSTYYAYVKVSTSPEGAGKVYQSESEVKSQAIGSNSGSNFTIELTAQANDGYSFSRWDFTQGEDTTTYEITGSTIKITGNTEATSQGTAEYWGDAIAYFNTENYKITFDTNGGTPPTYAPITYHITDASFDLPTPTRDGYTFADWQPSSSVGNWEANTSYSVCKRGMWGTVELVAQWTPNEYTITFDTNGGTPPTYAPITYHITDASFDLPTPTRDGYNFAGWQPSSSVGNWEANTSYDVPISGMWGTVELVAQWTLDEYTITFDTNGGTPPTYAPITYHITDASFDLPTPTRDGYTFAGWQTSTKVGNWEANTSYKVSPSDTWGDVTLVAKWDPLVYDISFIPNGGEFEGGGKDVINKSYNSDGTDPSGTGLINKLPKVSRVGYDFLGWSVSPDDDRVYGWGETVEPEASVVGKRGDVTLTAQWTPVNYQIDLNLNGGTLSDGATETTYHYNIEGTVDGDGYISTLPKVEKTGYSFNGWSIAATTQGESHGWGDTAVENASVKTHWGNVTLTAQWEAIPGYIKISVSGLQKNDSAVFEVSYDSVPFVVVSLDSSNASGLLVKIPDVRDGKSVTVTPKAWPKNYKGLTTTPKEKIVKFSNVRDKPVSYEFDLGERNLNIFETSREF